MDVRLVWVHRGLRGQQGGRTGGGAGTPSLHTCSQGSLLRFGFLTVRVAGAGIPAASAAAGAVAYGGGMRWRPPGCVGFGSRPSLRVRAAAAAGGRGSAAGSCWKLLQAAGSCCACLCPLALGLMVLRTAPNALEIQRIFGLHCKQVTPPAETTCVGARYNPGRTMTLNAFRRDDET